MRKCISLINVLFFLIDNIGVTSVDYAFDEVCCVIDFRKLVLIFNAVSSLF